MIDERRNENANTRRFGTVRNWASQLDDNAREMAERTSRSPAVSGPIALMPDAHWGMGATIGSVIPTKSAVIPAAVGVDIGCGMIAVKMSTDVSGLPDDLTPMLSAIERAIPAGFNWHDDGSARLGHDWMSDHPIPYTVGTLKDKPVSRAPNQLGTLGGGNHFVEVCYDIDRGGVWLVLHSGSRGIGNAIAQHFIRDCKSLCKDMGRAVEDPDLSYYLQSDLGFHRYVRGMLWAQDYAAENRLMMMDQLLAVFRTFVPGSLTMKQINCHHNYCEKEHHDGCDVWVTRKGAIRARRDDWGVIPGSMGAASYIVRGLGNAASYDSASHGAGRTQGRKETRRNHTAAEFEAAMPDGVTWQQGKSEDLLDEAPFAYKDIETVMADQRDLVKVEARLECVLNYKGV